MNFSFGHRNRAYGRELCVPGFSTEFNSGQCRRSEKEDSSCTHKIPKKLYNVEQTCDVHFLEGSYFVTRGCWPLC